MDEVFRNRWPETESENYTNMMSKIENREKRKKDKNISINKFQINDRAIIYQPQIESESFRIPFSQTIYKVKKIRGPMLYLEDENKKEKIRHFEHVVKIYERPDFLR